MNKIFFNMFNNKFYNSIGIVKWDNEIECILNNVIYL